jgi:hypothetical protein
MILNNAQHFSDKFQKYNFGENENLIKYGQSTPPNYSLSKTTLPVYMYYTDRDNLATPFVRLISIYSIDSRNKNYTIFRVFSYLSVFK